MRLLAPPRDLHPSYQELHFKAENMQRLILFYVKQTWKKLKEIENFAQYLLLLRVRQRIHNISADHPKAKPIW